ncbi:hypothetical protein EJ02DRAFT_454281 [Clathrospora elynae]|uniref:Uncharacterized protein n=1 Tax=Clathrospora elynae TaxID=706981 RepID=A0A6A5SP64_9PLEO|nr:hypothetical protein EJ02DRAFT_454281 [Clathrospora elynae]
MTSTSNLRTLSSIPSLSHQPHHACYNPAISERRSNPTANMTDSIPKRGSKEMLATTIIAVAIQTSQPIDSNAPSFLTTIPPEIRNEIYMLLFQRDEPIIYTGPRHHRATEFYDDEHNNEDTIRREEQA